VPSTEKLLPLPDTNRGLSSTSFYDDFLPISLLAAYCPSSFSSSSLSFNGPVDKKKKEEQPNEPEGFFLFLLLLFARCK